MHDSGADFESDIQIIADYSHIWNWAPDWYLLRDIYASYPSSYSVLTPFAYSYLEESIRSLTSEYGRKVVNKKGKPKRRKVGKGLLELAEKENQENLKLISVLESLKHYFDSSRAEDTGDNRNSTLHGYMHPRYWTRSSFESLVHDIARLSPYVRF